MRSENKGACAYLKEDSPNSVFTWCASHRLNLAVNSGCESSVQTKSVLGLLEQTAVFFKDSYKRMDMWNSVVKSIKGYNSLKKLQLIGKTRWWSKEKAIRNLLDRPFDLFVVLQVLQNIENSPKFDPASIAAAKRFKNAWLDYDNLITAINLKEVFTFVSPATNYLQTKGLNIVAALKMMKIVSADLKGYRNNFEDLKYKVNDFCTDLNSLLENSDVIGVVDTGFKVKTTHRRKKMSGENCSDEAPTDADTRFRVNVFFPLIDVLDGKIEERFLNIEEESILTEIYSVSPENLHLFNNSIKLPKLCALAGIKNEAKLKEEIMSFTKIYKNLNLDQYVESDEESDEEIFEENDKEIDEEIVDENDENIDGETDEEFVEENFKESDEIVDENDENGETVDKPEMENRTNCTGNCENCFGCVLVILKNYKLFTKTYNRVYELFKAILILPSTQVHCERSFSKLKIVKNRIRSNLRDENVENLMICSIENEILANIDNQKIINIYAATTPTLSRLLIG